MKPAVTHHRIRPGVRIVLAAAAAALLLSACGGGGSTTPPVTTPQAGVFDTSTWDNAVFQ